MKCASSPSSIKWLIGVTGCLAGLLISTIQLSMSPWLLFSGLAAVVFGVVGLNRFGGSVEPSYKGSSPLSFHVYGFNPLATSLLQSTVMFLLILNVIWACRWFAGVENVVSGIYGVSVEDLETLRQCGIEHPYMTVESKCNILSSFIANPLFLYIHVAGAVACLALGPLQLSAHFRRSYPTIHKPLGYIYATSCVIGSLGSFGLIVQSTSGVAAGLGFVTLMCLWIWTLVQGVRFARAKEYAVHREWMIRNYILTFAAVPFRFLPGLLQLMGVPPYVAYPQGAWLSVIFSVIFAEWFVRKTRESQNSEPASAASIVNPLNT